MDEATSLFEWDVRRVSADGCHTAHFLGGEKGMGGPSVGRITLKSKIGAETRVAEIEPVGASFVWSDDSRFLAFSYWVDQRQILATIDVAFLEISRSNRGFTWIELQAFSGFKISGINVVGSERRPFALSVSQSGNIMAG